MHSNDSKRSQRTSKRCLCSIFAGHHTDGTRGLTRAVFTGKRIVDLQTSLALIQSPKPSAGALLKFNSDLPIHWQNREPVGHPALTNIEILTSGKSERSLNKQRMLDHGRVAQLARDYSLQEVIRWKPRQLHNLESSGIGSVLAHTLYAIVGAVALSRGGEMATKAVRNRILRPLGLVRR